MKQHKISMRIGLPDLVVDDAWDRVFSFFTQDRSSRFYDEYIRGGTSPPSRIVGEDITAINTSMRARSPHADWRDLVERDQDLPELAAVDPSWDLFETPPDIWEEQLVPRRLCDLFAAVIRPGIGISRATKVLHIKRPHLIPVCDAYVLRLIGIPGESADSGVALIQHYRKQGRSNYLTLRLLQDRLGQADPPIVRTLVRILDVLVWGSHPDAHWTPEPPPQPGGPAPSPD